MLLSGPPRDAPADHPHHGLVSRGSIAMAGGEQPFAAPDVVWAPFVEQDHRSRSRGTSRSRASSSDAVEPASTPGRSRDPPSNTGISGRLRSPQARELTPKGALDELPQSETKHRARRLSAFKRLSSIEMVVRMMPCVVHHAHQQ